MSADSITDYVLTMLNQNKFEQEPGFGEQLYQYIHNNYIYSPFHNFEYGTYIYHMITEASCCNNSRQVLKSQIPPDIEVSVPATLAALNGLIGLNNVKKEVLEKATGEVLFIDEAYALGEKGSFNEEIVATIIKVMEDSRDELIIIFAGYTKSMKQFFSMNEGLRSRIGRTLYFDDYTADELTEIAVKKLKDIDYSIAPEGAEEIKHICEAATKQPDFGNGRFADLFVQKIIRSHASLYQDGEDILHITREDVIHARELL